MAVDTEQYEVSDLVKYAYEGQPSKMQDVFNEIMANRVYDSIQQKKVEVAQQFFGTQDDTAEEDYEEEDTDDGQDS